jgi:two-component system response regulator CpxR
MKSANNIVSKADISQKILQRKLSPFDRSIDMHMSNIRRKFLPFSPNDKFKTIRGSGYIFLTGEG